MEPSRSCQAILYRYCHLGDLFFKLLIFMNKKTEKILKILAKILCRMFEDYLCIFFPLLSTIHLNQNITFTSLLLLTVLHWHGSEPVPLLCSIML